MKTKATSIVAILLLSLFFSSCEKAEQFIQKAVLSQVITSDRWVVETFAVAGTDVTSEYAPYEFEFHKNGTVTAFKSTQTIVGDWKEDLNALSIETYFNDPAVTLQRFNNIWYIGKSAATYVEARAVTATGVLNLKLVKKQ